MDFYSIGIEMRLSALLLLLITSIALNAAESGEVPKKLFDVPVGGIFNIGTGIDGAAGELPVKRFVDFSWEGRSGISYFFEPLNDYSVFEFKEYQDENSGQVRATFRLFLIPIIPEVAATDHDVDETQIDWEVVQIVWRDLRDSTVLDQVWAVDWCDSVSADLGISAEVLMNNLEFDIFICEFAADSRRLVVSSSQGRSIRLSYSADIIGSKVSAVEKRMRQLEMERIRPY